jgi:hypothetical protein
MLEHRTILRVFADKGFFPVVIEKSAGVVVPLEPSTTRQASMRLDATAMGHIGNSKRVVVDNTARRFGKLSATKALPLKEIYQ